MSDNILITGAKGQLGSELSKLLPDALLTDVAELDITDFTAVQRFVRENGVETVINCAAYTAVDKAEEDEKSAYEINVTGVKNLAMACKKIIHISTDYVFDGTGCRPYEPSNETKPVSVYGKTKRLGESAALENCNTAIVIRTAWLYSPYGKNFVKTIRNLGREKEVLNVVTDQIGTPTYAADLANAVADILPKIGNGQKDIYHFTNEGVCSWYDFAEKIIKLSGLPCRVNPVLSDFYPTKAKRPFYSVLSKEKIKRDFKIKIPHWEDGLKRCINEMEKTK